ncbi:MAG: alpha/beta fold hydrolase [Myxococcales bacterium]|nr:alpha/beta fold hydrolase [Myxococcales bacterium]
MRLVPRHLYPFEPKRFDLDGLTMSYLDEGAGPPVVMVHGNPTWSFYYRRLVSALSPTHRCIVPDHIGMGLSDKPGDDRYEYTLARRVDDLERLLDHLELDEPVTLIVHDWGGMIGMAWAARHPERIARLVIMNTAAFPLPADRRFHAPLRLTRTPVGGLLVRRFNAFAVAATRLCVTRRPLAPEVRDAYTAPYDSWDHRIATLRFVQDIPLGPDDPGYAIVAATRDQLHRFRSTPTLILWGEKDFVFDAPFLREWREHLPEARVVRFPTSGHYVLEDAHEEIVPLVTQFVGEDRGAPEAYLGA